MTRCNPLMCIEETVWKVCVKTARTGQIGEIDEKPGKLRILKIPPICLISQIGDDIPNCSRTSHGCESCSLTIVQRQFYSVYQSWFKDRLNCSILYQKKKKKITPKKN